MKTIRSRLFSPTRCGLLAGAFTAIVMTSPLGATENLGRDWEGDSKEDAGDTPATAQKVIIDTSNTVKTIKGELKGEDDGGLAGDGNPLPDFQDVYEIVIKDPGLFFIKTTPPLGSTEFDSLLGVYNKGGFALLANEDAKPNILGSRIDNQSTDGLFHIDQPGAIYISISGAASRPVTGQNQQVFAFTDNPADVVGPTQDGQESPFAGWTGPGQIGHYVIELNAVAPVPSNCGVENTASCFEVHPAPFCNDDACCAAVCTVNPFCCDVTWDENCANDAEFLCDGGEGGCGSAAAESCYEIHESPYCDYGPCCATVCSFIPDCCLFNWGPECVDLALEICQANCNFDCPADLNFDGRVDGPDLATMLGAWLKGGCADLNGDGEVAGADLAILLGQWGDCFK